MFVMSLRFISLSARWSNEMTRVLKLTAWVVNQNHTLTFGGVADLLHVPRMRQASVLIESSRENAMWHMVNEYRLSSHVQA